MSEVATHRWHNAAALFYPESQQLSFPSPSVGVTQAWSHCWAYLLDERDGMGQENRCDASDQLS